MIAFIKKIFWIKKPKKIKQPLYKIKENNKRLRARLKRKRKK